MRKPHTIERLYLDFDGFFASVMQQAMPVLRNRPVGVIPFDTTAAHRTVVIACSKEAKARGCRNIMPVPEALRVCPELVLVPQRTDLYRRAHGALLAEIDCEIPIDAVKSIDELTCVLDRRGIADPHGLANRIKTRLKVNIGPYITCSIGFAANRMLAKIACKMDKPDGVTIWPPEIMPGPLETLTFDDVPGIGGQMAKRLERAEVFTIRDLLHTQPRSVGNHAPEDGLPIIGHSPPDALFLFGEQLPDREEQARDHRHAPGFHVGERLDRDIPEPGEGALVAFIPACGLEPGAIHVPSILGADQPHLRAGRTIVEYLASGALDDDEFLGVRIDVENDIHFEK